MQQQKHTVIIIGAGPTGLALACQLQRYNIDFVILDRNEKTTHLSKAMIVHARTLEIFNEIGLAERAVQTGQRAQRFNMMTRGKLRGQLQLTAFGNGLSQFPFALVLEQSKTEKLMADYLNEKGIAIQWSSEVTHFEDNADGVTVFYKDQSRNEHTIKGSYLIGCDGSSSLIRHQLGLHFEGDTQERIFYVADVKLESPFKGHENAWFIMIENGFALFFPMEGEQHYRVIGTVPENIEEREKIQFSDIRQTIKKQVQAPIEFLEEYWFATYKVHSRMVDTFRKGNCFVAGDAAHIHTPAGGQGMNTGIQDAYNLAWKLAFVINGKADKKLLDTYNEERLANAKRLLKTTDRMFDILAGTGWLSNFFRLRFFPLIIKLVTSSAFINRRIFPLLSMIGIKYPESSLTIKSSVGKIEAGDRMPYFLINGESIFEQLKDPTCKVLYFGKESNNHLGEIPEAKIEILQLAFTQIPEQFQGNTDFYIAIRPDNHISYIGNEIEKVKRSLQF
jgi:2-polyprenyl-6-methoxyphenol hydroxylase-like FAD-dependent oxidoreductase